MQNVNTFILLFLLLFAGFISFNDTDVIIAFLKHGFTETTATAPPECTVTKRKICRDTKNQCIPVYLAKEEINDCIEYNQRKTYEVCGSKDATLYRNDKSCWGDDIVKNSKQGNCPSHFRQLSTHHVNNLHECTSIHVELCQAICGANYGSTDIRMSRGSFSLMCIDGKINHSRANCDEIHQAAGVRAWCIRYNHRFSGITLGHKLNCVGRLR